MADTEKNLETISIKEQSEDVLTKTFSTLREFRRIYVIAQTKNLHGYTLDNLNIRQIRREIARILTALESK